MSLFGAFMGSKRMRGTPLGGGGSSTVQIMPIGTGINTPVMWGDLFADGAISPIDNLVVEGVATSQVVIQNRYPSGSPRHVTAHAILPSVADGVPQNLTISAGTPAGGANVTDAAIIAAAASIVLEVTQVAVIHQIQSIYVEGRVATPGQQVALRPDVYGTYPWGLPGTHYAWFANGGQRFYGPVRITQGSTEDILVFPDGGTNIYYYGALGQLSNVVVNKTPASASVKRTMFQGPVCSLYQWFDPTPIFPDSQLYVEWWFYVYANGQIDFSVWINNGLCRTGNCPYGVYEARVLVSGVEKARLKMDGDPTSNTFWQAHHTRVPVGANHLLTEAPRYWLKHDGVRLGESKTVPNYDDSPFNDAGLTWDTQQYNNNILVGNARAGFAPGQMWWNEEPAYGGWRDDIGILPRCDALYLTCAKQASPIPPTTGGLSGHQAAWNAMWSNAWNFWSWPYLLRDEGDGWGRADMASDYWKIRNVLGDGNVPAYVTATGYNTSLRSWDPRSYNYNYSYPVSPSHVPSAGYLPYLMTGRREFLEHLLYTIPSLIMGLRGERRGYEKGYFVSPQDRSTAWGFRQLGFALAALPDSETTERIRYKAFFDNNLDIVGPDQFPTRHPLGLWPIQTQVPKDTFVAQPTLYHGGSDLDSGPSIGAWWDQAYKAITFSLLADLKIVNAGAEQTLIEQLRDEQLRWVSGIYSDGTAGFGYDYRWAAINLLIYCAPPGTDLSSQYQLWPNATLGSYRNVAPVFQTWAEFWNANAQLPNSAGDTYYKFRNYKDAPRAHDWPRGPDGVAPPMVDGTPQAGSWSDRHWTGIAGLAYAVDYLTGEDRTRALAALDNLTSPELDLNGDRLDEIIPTGIYGMHATGRDSVVWALKPRTA